MNKYSLALDSTEKVKHLTESLDRSAGFRIRKRRWWENFLKRFIDIIVSSLVIVIGFPFFLSISLLIKLTSKGPVFFTQERVGENGELFNFHKFRTMRAGIDDTLHREFTRDFIQGRMRQSTLDGKDSSIYKLKNDPRITSVGNFLRRTSLDELPQFINILKGEMTLVGPRPPLQYEYDCYEEWHKLRLSVKPGLTGLWQVNGRSSVPFHEMVKLDLYYIGNWSLLLDFKIVIRTVPVMFAGTGGY